MKYCFALLFVLLIISEFSFSQQIMPHPKVYACVKADKAPIIDGKINEEAWQQAKWTDDFIDIEGENKTLPTYTTRVKMMWDDSTLYIAAYLEEPHIWATLTERESIIYVDNDFEIFIDPDGDNHLYYEMEFNAFGTEWDLMLPKPYRNQGIPLFGWNCNGMKSAVAIYGSINDPKDTDSCWTFEAALPWSCLCDAVRKKKQFGDGDYLRMNFSRVEWDTKIENNHYIKLKKPEHNWVWSPQYHINMHMPEYWGYVLLCEDTATKFLDTDWETKALMMQFYKAQKKYFKIHKSYSNDVTKLGYDNPIKDLKLEANQYQFLFIYHTKNYNWYINHNSKLWKEKQ